MKKLIMLLTIGALALATQAATVKWSYGATSTDVGQTVYVLLGTTAKTDWASLDDVKAASVSQGKVSKVGRNYLATGDAISDSITKTSADLYYVIVSADEQSYAVTSSHDFKGSAFGEQDSALPSDGSLSSANITKSGLAFGGTTPGGNGPEPTSGLLMLVGGAMLALRRKQK